MAKKQDKDSAVPTGVKLLRSFEGPTETVLGVAFDAQGEMLASGSVDTTVRLWATGTGKLLRTLQGHKKQVRAVAFNPASPMLASAGGDNSIKLWNPETGDLLRTLEGHTDAVHSVAFAPTGTLLASTSYDKKVKVWDSRSGALIRTLDGHKMPVLRVVFDPQGRLMATCSGDDTAILWEVSSGKLIRVFDGEKHTVWSVAFDREGTTLAGGSGDMTIKLWETATGKLLRRLEGHTQQLEFLNFSPDGRLLASTSRDRTIRLWNSDTWETVATVEQSIEFGDWLPALAFHPTLPLLAAAGSQPGPTNGRGIALWELDIEALLGRRVKAAERAVHHTTGKIVLVGDHSVGKSALGYRLIHGRFEKQESTHGQKFWVFPALGKRRADETECEAILWDFAGQPDYRLVHALFVDNADLALVLFDASDLRDPLHGVGFWLKQLKTGASRCSIILVAAQTDRGTSSMTQDELTDYCRKHGIQGPIATSAVTGDGVEELIERMKVMIPWEEKTATVTTSTFKRIKDYCLGLKEEKSDGHAIVKPEELRKRLEATDHGWRFTDDEMLTAVGHLENYGYVRRLRTSKGEHRILLQPERLNNLASSFVLEARRNPKGLGALEEKRLLTGGYDFPEIKDLAQAERDVLLDSATLLFLEHNVCFRETDPLRNEPYLVFPELINLKKPLEDDAATEDGAAYTVSGPTENVFASLVVLLGYTHTFIRTAQWNNNARYEVGDRLVCGFRQDGERDGELDLVLCFGRTVGVPVRTVFQGLFESFLARRNLTVMRYESVRCSKGHQVNRAVVRDALQQGETTTFCSKCGEQLVLPKTEPIQLTREEQAQVESQRRTADQRTLFEQAIFRVRAFHGEKTAPEVFVSYAWGVPEHERWVEKRLAPDLQKAGIQIVFDRKDNQLGDSLTRFVSRIPYCSGVVVVGTPLYFQKFENRLASTGSVVAAEVGLISQRLIGTEKEKQTVKSLLLAGEKKTSLPPLMWDGIHADFREESKYFINAFDLVLSWYEIPRRHSAVADLWESLEGPAVR